MKKMLVIVAVLVAVWITWKAFAFLAFGTTDLGNMNGLIIISGVIVIILVKALYTKSKPQ